MKKNYQEEFLKKNPDKKIISCSHRIFHDFGTSKYVVEWSGDWSCEELVNYCDGGTGNYGGRIDNLVDTDTGTHKGIVCVYYD